MTSKASPASSASFKSSGRSTFSRPYRCKHPTYPLGPADREFMREVIEYYVRPRRAVSLRRMYRHLCAAHYCEIGELGQPVLKPLGQRPSIYQLRRMITKVYGSMRDLPASQNYAILEV